MPETKDPGQGQGQSKTLEMRVAELEDKLSQMHISEEDMQTYQRVASKLGAGGAAPCQQCQQAAPPCIAAQAQQPCVAAQQASQPCVAAQSISPIYYRCYYYRCYYYRCYYYNDCILAQDPVGGQLGGGGGFGGFGM